MQHYSNKDLLIILELEQLREKCSQTEKELEKSNKVCILIEAVLLWHKICLVVEINSRLWS